jgi:hypothetical protein
MALSDSEIATLLNAQEFNYLGQGDKSALLEAFAGLGSRTVLTDTIADVSTASSILFVMPFAGEIKEIQTVLGGAITGADAAITVKKNGGSAISGFGVTVANASSAKGDVDSDTPTSALTVAKGDFIEVLTDGASTGTQTLGVNLILAKS